MSDPIVFLASFPPIQSAIKIGQDGMRIQFDVPESEMANAVELLALRNVVLKVAVEPAATNERPKGTKSNLRGPGATY